MEQPRLEKLQEIRNQVRDLETDPAWVSKNLVIPWLTQLGFPTHSQQIAGDTPAIVPVTRKGAARNTLALWIKTRPEVEILIVGEHQNLQISQKEFSQFEDSPAPLFAITNGSSIAFYAPGEKTLHGEACREFSLESATSNYSFLNPETYNRQTTAETLGLSKKETELLISNPLDKGFSSNNAGQSENTQKEQAMEPAPATLVSFLEKLLQPGNPGLLQFAKETYPETTPEELERALLEIRNKVVCNSMISALSNIGGFIPKISEEPVVWGENPNTNDTDAGTKAPAVPEPKDENEIALEAIQELFSGIISPERLNLRLNQTYVAVLLDDNNRKTICRLYLRGSRPTIAFLDSDKKEARQILSGNITEALQEHRKTLFQTAAGLGIIIPDPAEVPASE